MKPNTSSPSAKEEPPSPAYSVIAGMETDIRAASDMANAVVMMMSGWNSVALDREDQIGAVLCVAYSLRAHAANAVADWEKAFAASKGGRA